MCSTATLTHQPGFLKEAHQSFGIPNFGIPCSQKASVCTLCGVKSFLPQRRSWYEGKMAVRMPLACLQSAMTRAVHNTRPCPETIQPRLLLTTLHFPHPSTRHACLALQHPTLIHFLPPRARTTCITLAFPTRCFPLLGISTSPAPLVHCITTMHSNAAASPFYTLLTALRAPHHHISAMLTLAYASQGMPL